MIRRLPHVDRIGIEERAASLGKRSIKTSAKLQGIRLAMSMIDLTTLEGQDTPGKVRQLVRQGRVPGPDDARDPVVAAVCVYPALVPVVARRAARAPASHIAAVSTGFPSGQTSLDDQAAGDEEAVAAGADEIDMVISREAFLAGDDARVHGGDRARQGGVRRRAPEGDPRDRRAADLRPRPPRLDARDGGRRGLHQDLDRQGASRRDARASCS